MNTHRILIAAAVAALTMILGGAALRSKTPSVSAVHADPIEAPADPSRDGDYVWDPVDRYWDKDHNDH